MEVQIIEDVIFRRVGALKTVEAEIPIAIDPTIGVLRWTKCKKYKTQPTYNPIVEMGIYFKLTDCPEDLKNYEVKIVIDLFISDKEKYFREYDITELKKELQAYNISDIDYVCNKVVESIKHDYF